VQDGAASVRQHREMAARPKKVTVRYRGTPYSLNLVACRRALVGRQVDGELDRMESLAVAVGVSRLTASRFLRQTHLAGGHAPKSQGIEADVRGRGQAGDRRGLGGVNTAQLRRTARPGTSSGRVGVR
jgi:hypothetical protein